MSHDPLVALTRAVDLLGGQSAAARACGVKQAHVWNWLHRQKGVPAEYVRLLAGATNWQIRPCELRPDLYPHPDDGLPGDLRIGEAA